MQDWNKRIRKSADDKPKKKKPTGFLIKKFKIEEVLDESGEVLDDTVIRFNLDGILIYLSIADAMKFAILLDKVLNFKK